MLAALPLAALSVRGGDVAPKPEPLRILTFNIYSDWRAPNWGVPPRAAGVERAIVKAQPDIVALQEVVADWWANPMFEHLAATYGIVRGNEADAIRRAGPPPETKPGKPEPGRCNKCPLLYRKDRLSLLDFGFEIFHVALGGMSKSVTWAVLEDRRSGRRFMSFSTHFWFKHNCPESDTIRELNARHILRIVSDVRRKYGNIPVIGGGDLNCVPGSLAHETFKREGYLNAMDVAEEKTARSATRTYHGRLTQDEKGLYHGTVAPPGKDKPEQSIDHIFFNGGIRALKYDIDLDQETLDASDHSPVVVDFIIKSTECRQGYVLEHTAIDVADPVATANWWVDNLGFEITMQKTDETHTTFIVDRTGCIALELYRAKDALSAPDYHAMRPLQLHFGFLSDDVDADIARLTTAGATLVVHEKSPGFDGAMMKDPSGISIQFVKRGKPVLRK